MIRTFRSLVLALVLAIPGLLAPADAAAQPAEVQMCSGQAVPAGYVVVATTSRSQCPNYSAWGNNSFTLRIPGDTITACASLTPQLPGYVVTANGTSSRCPDYSAWGNNTTTFQRVGPPGTGSGPGVATGSFAVLDQYDRTVYQRMDEMEEWLGLGIPTHQMWRASAQPGTSARGSLQVQAGTRYTVVGVCDDDCTDLDLRVLDGGYVVAEDVARDAYARLELTPARAGMLTVEVIMAACGNAPCRYGVSVYETPQVTTAPAGPPRRERIRPPANPVRPTRQQRP